MTAVLGRMLGILYGVRRWLLEQQWFNSTVLPMLPRSLRWTLRKAYFLPADLMERFLGQRDDMVPPKASIFTGTVDEFRRSGEVLVDRLVRYAGLTSASRVVDIGCGMGRLAAALTRYLGPEGSYRGLDIVPAGIQWCQDNISRRHANFAFTLADVYNKEYLPTGRTPASQFRFPYEDDTADVVVLSSVFTHMLPADFESYVAEIARVLRSGGVCYATFSLVDAESRRTMRSGAASLRFAPHFGPCWVVDPKVPELAVGYDEEYVRATYASHGLNARYDVHPGRWARRQSTMQQTPEFNQDVVVATLA
jgi:SAM-dependent methyltransferase